MIQGRLISPRSLDCEIALAKALVEKVDRLQFLLIYVFIVYNPYWFIINGDKQYNQCQEFNSAYNLHVNNQEVPLPLRLISIIP